MTINRAFIIIRFFFPQIEAFSVFVMQKEKILPQWLKVLAQPVDNIRFAEAALKTWQTGPEA